MILILDSTRGTELRAGLFNSRLRVLVRKYDAPASSELLKLVDALLKREHVSVKSLTGIVIALGPGPFSALRTAAALANGLSFALNIPAVGVRGTLSMRQLVEQGRKKLARASRNKFGIGVPVVPFYGKKPNITKRKRT